MNYFLDLQSYSTRHKNYSKQKQKGKKKVQKDGNLSVNSIDQIDEDIWETDNESFESQSNLNVESSKNSIHDLY